MKALALIAAVLLSASCYRDSGNSPLPITPEPESPNIPDNGGGSGGGGTNPDIGGGDDGDGDDVVIDTCANDNATDPLISEHNLNVYYDDGAEKYVIDFASASNADLKVVSLYITNEGASIPIFPEFELVGTPYWMVSVDFPFGEYFNLPTYYGETIEPGIDVTENYDGVLGGVNLSDIPLKTCLMFSIVTFEEDKDPAFRTSTFYKSHKI